MISQDETFSKSPRIVVDPRGRVGVVLGGKEFSSVVLDGTGAVLGAVEMLAGNWKVVRPEDVYFDSAATDLTKAMSPLSLDRTPLGALVTDSEDIVLLRDAPGAALRRGVYLDGTGSGMVFGGDFDISRWREIAPRYVTMRMVPDDGS